MKEQSCKVRVSAAFGQLRQAQGRLNQFLWSTELSYGVLLADQDLRDRSAEWAQTALHGVMAEAWFPNAKGASKYNHRVGTFLGHVRDNIPYVYSAVIVLFAAAFEQYLESKRTQIGLPSKQRWGPYYKSLCRSGLYWAHAAGESRLPLSLNTVLTADMCRLLRNAIAHESGNWPKSVEDARNDWRNQFAELTTTDWNPRTKGRNPEQCKRELGQSLENALHTFVGGAAHQVRRARQHHQKKLPIQHFYMLFTLTSLDRLAFEIEEALLGPPSPDDVLVNRDPDDVRRKELIVDGPENRAAGT